MRSSQVSIQSILAAMLLLAPILAACNAAPTAPPPISTLRAQTMITFRVTLPSPLNPGESLNVIMLDEVTGLAFNRELYPMTAEDDRHYITSLPLTMNSVVKYRYQRQGNYAAPEHLSDGRPVRYRMYAVNGPGVAEDIVSRWTDTQFAGSTGRLQGILTDAQGGQPLPNMLVSAGGAQAFSAADGSFLIEGLPVGAHHVVAYDPGGNHYPSQQGAVIAANAATPALFSLAPAPLVNVAFVVRLPANTPPEATVRLAGNLQSLGNTFADLTGGWNSVAARMPTLTRLPDGRFSLTLALPAGVDLHYKYTLGDGLWSAELGPAGEFVTRQALIPENGGMLEDTVATWDSPNRGTLTFEVAAPTASAEDGVSIQFHPGFSWTEPIPMWPAGEGRWRFALTSPLHLLNEIGYRYCRADQCGQADDARTIGSDSPPQGKITLTAEPQTVQDTVTAWAWQVTPGPVVVPNLTVKPRSLGFAAGIEFSQFYEPTWLPRWPQAVRAVNELNANWLILPTTWSFTRADPPMLEAVAGQDIPWQEAVQLSEQANAAGLQTAIFPAARFGVESGQWWQTARRDFAWWTSWFDRYRTFVIHHADLAARAGAKALILGGEWVTPALPEGILSDGSASGVPADAEERWRTVLAEVRAHFPNGKILWALPYAGQASPAPVKMPPFFDVFDGIYVLWSPPLIANGDASLSGMQAEAGRLLDTDLRPLQEKLNKPLWLGINNPSAKGGAAGCVASPAGGCLSVDDLARLREDIPEIAVDFNEQTDVYIALFSAIETRPWIDGVISRGFSPPLALQDKSASVRGKPAAGVLWFWFPRWLVK